MRRTDLADLWRGAAIIFLFTACRDGFTPAPPVWPEGASGEEKVEYLTTFLDDQVGKPFPDIGLTDARTGRRASLFETSQGKILVLNFAEGCPSTTGDVAYFNSIGWRRDGVDTIVVLVSRSNVDHYLKLCDPAAQIMTTKVPLPSWLERLYASPQVFFLDGTTRRLDRWVFHLEEALAFVEAQNQLGG